MFFLLSNWKESSFLKIQTLQWVALVFTFWQCLVGYMFTWGFGEVKHNCQTTGTKNDISTNLKEKSRSFGHRSPVVCSCSGRHRGHWGETWQLLCATFTEVHACRFVVITIDGNLQWFADIMIYDGYKPRGRCHNIVTSLIWRNIVSGDFEMDVSSSPRKRLFWPLSMKSSISLSCPLANLYSTR